ncbi:NAD(P)H-dependent flavin oxidoreductase [Noviherbaspirillum aerium]|uniref:NAD(P)H-dependent flavin oxidoreductase n=1 Tax=Noviherbaspirillum aerium TaxID=2588497 RepID=UPI00124CF964|nr:nitronate monooxygenase family protein [Noviherbaspirillum aerium]
MPLPKALEGKLDLPVIASPLFIISNPELVIAQCCAGIVGSFPALNARPQEELGKWIVRIKQGIADFEAANPGRKAAPFAVNQIVHQSNSRVDADMAVCVEHKVPVIITSLRSPASLVDQVHGYGGIVLHDVTNVRHAKKAIEAGVDGLILVCAGAGGHAGVLSPFALVNEIRSFYSGPLALSGSITNGSGIYAAQAMGCDLAYIGTRFIATEEANASQEYKDMLIDSSAADIVYTPYFTGVPGNYLKPSIARNGLDPDNLPSADPSKMNFDNRHNKPKSWKEIWGAGQGVGNISAVEPAATLIGRMKAEYQEARQRMGALAA